MISYEIKETGYFGNLRIFSSAGILIKELANSVNLGASGFWKWDGRNEAGRVASAGLYLAVFELNKQGESTSYVRIPLAVADDR
jgi:hypothetical protein